MEWKIHYPVVKKCINIDIDEVNQVLNTIHIYLFAQEHIKSFYGHLLRCANFGCLIEKTDESV